MTRQLDLVLHFIIILVDATLVRSRPPVQLLIECGSCDQVLQRRKTLEPRLSENNRDLNVTSFCDLIQKSIPKAIEDGKFILAPRDMDQSGYADSIAPVAVLPPVGFKRPKLLKKFRTSRINVPKINVPFLRKAEDIERPPVIGRPMAFARRRDFEPRDESSAERMERFKKGVQKMMNFVKVLGQIDRYVSDRTRIVVDKLAKTFGD